MASITFLFVYTSRPPSATHDVTSHVLYYPWLVGLNRDCGSERKVGKRAARASVPTCCAIENIDSVRQLALPEDGYRRS